MSSPPSCARRLGDPGAQCPACRPRRRPRHGLHALAGERRHRLVDAGPAAGAQRQVAALVGQQLGDRAADAAGSAGDDRLFAPQTEIHLPSLCGRRPRPRVNAAAGRADAHRRRRRAAARSRPRCSAASSTGWRGPAIPGSRADRRRRPSRCVAKLWRSACGVAVAGSPRKPRNASICRCTRRGCSGPPRAPTKSGPSAASAIGAGGEIVGDRRAHRRQHRQLALLAAFAGDRQHLAERRLAAAQARAPPTAAARSRRAAPGARYRACPASLRGDSSPAASTVGDRVRRRSAAWARRAAISAQRSAASAVVEASPRRCRKRTKPRNTDMPRASELRSMPSPARRAR